MLFEQTITPGSGSLVVVVALQSPLDANFYPNDTFYITEKASSTVWRDAATGTRYAPDSVSVDSFGVLTYTWASGLPNSFGNVLISFGDPAVRGRQGQFIGTFMQTATPDP